MTEQQAISLSRKDAIAKLVKVLERCHPDYFVRMANQIDPDNSYVNNVPNQASFSVTPIPQYNSSELGFTITEVATSDYPE